MEDLRDPRSSTPRFTLQGSHVTSLGQAVLNLEDYTFKVSRFARSNLGTLEPKFSRSEPTWSSALRPQPWTLKLGKGKGVRWCVNTGRLRLGILFEVGVDKLVRKEHNERREVPTPARS